MKKRLLSGIAMLCACVSACDDSNTTPSACTSDMCKDDKILLVCDATTGSTTEKTCENGCKNGACTEASQRCAANRCKDDKILLVCDLASGKTTEKTCDNGCANNACAEKAEEKCTANQCADEKALLECDIATGKAQKKVCPNGCANGACLEKSEEKCEKSVCLDEKTLLECNTDSGETSQRPCALGCENGACVSKIGQPCTDTGIAYCEGDDFISCSDETGMKVWTKLTCPNGFVCGVYDEETLCLEKCDKEGEKSSVCGGDNYYGMMQIETVCTKVDDEHMYFIKNNDAITECTFGCKDRKVCLEQACTTKDEKCLGPSEGTICEVGNMSIMTCGAESVCVYKSNNMTYCGPMCDPNDKKTKMCWRSGDNVGYAKVECRKGEGDAYGYVLIEGIENCDTGKCDDATGCIK